MTGQSVYITMAYIFTAGVLLGFLALTLYQKRSMAKALREKNDQDHNEA